MCNLSGALIKDLTKFTSSDIQTEPYLISKVRSQQVRQKSCGTFIIYRKQERMKVTKVELTTQIYLHIYIFLLLSLSLSIDSSTVSKYMLLINRKKHFINYSKLLETNDMWFIKSYIRNNAPRLSALHCICHIWRRYSNCLKLSTDLSNSTSLDQYLATALVSRLDLPNK